MKIFKIDVTNIDKNTVAQIYDMVSNPQVSAAIDLCNVESCVNEFFEMLSKLQNKITLVNVDSRILAALYMTGYDKFVKIFEDNLSLEANKHEIINRRFTLV